MTFRPTSEPVVITGIGVISPLGQTVAQITAALDQGRSGIGPLQGDHTRSLPLGGGGEAWDFSGKIEDFGELPAEKKKAIRKGLKVMCREIQMGVAAAQRALQDSGLEQIELDVDRTGVVFGSDYITTMPEEFQLAVEKCLNDSHEFDFGNWGSHGIPQISPLWLLKYLPNMPACHVAIYNDFRGANNSITVREASANLALGEALSTAQRGIVDRIVVGATGSRLHPLRSLHIVLQETVAESAGADRRVSGGGQSGGNSGGSNSGGNSSGNLSTAGSTATLSVPGCRPFDRNRTGMVLGEGAAAVTLETESVAARRGATVWGRLLGWGSSAAGNRAGVADRSQALVNAMRMALAQAGVSVDQVGHVHAHGLGTIAGDQEEGRALETVFAERRGGPVPVVAAKSYFGNLGAGSGMVELITSLVSLRRGTLFPILNLEQVDPECIGQADRVQLVRTHDVPAGRNVLNINVTPQGQASAVVVSL